MATHEEQNKKGTNGVFCKGLPNNQIKALRQAKKTEKNHMTGPITEPANAENQISPIPSFPRVRIAVNTKTIVPPRHPVSDSIKKLGRKKYEKISTMNVEKSKKYLDTSPYFMSE